MAASPGSASAAANDLFDQFMSASTLKSVVTTFRRICQLLDLKPGAFCEFYPNFKKGLAGSHTQTKNWKAQSVFNKIDRKASHRIYQRSANNQQTASSGAGHSGPGLTRHHAKGFSPQTSVQNNSILEDQNCLIIGGGPCGLRTAIELQLLGASHVVVIEKRDRFSRNNVLHLWPFVIADLKQMAGKKFYGKFCAGSIDHVSIRQLQLMLLKFALILGVDFIENITFDEICPKSLVPSLKSKSESQNGCSDNSSHDSEATDQCNSCPDSKGKESLPDEQISASDSISDAASSGSHNSSLAASSSSGGRKAKRNVKFNDCENENIDDDDKLRMQASREKRLIKTRKSDKMESCVCCCHIHSAGRSYWHKDATFAKYQTGAYAHFSLTSHRPTTASSLIDYDQVLQRLHGFQFNIVLGADGRRNTLADHFPRKEFRGRLAIAITANFVNTHTLKEAQIPEISGISFIYNQQLFR